MRGGVSQQITQECNTRCALRCENSGDAGAACIRVFDDLPLVRERATHGMSVVAADLDHATWRSRFASRKAKIPHKIPSIMQGLVAGGGA